MGNRAYRRAVVALGRAFVAVSPGLTLTRSGAVSHFTQNLVPGTDPAWFEAELDKGDGRELEGKFKAAHSSSALAVNTFARFKTSFSYSETHEVAPARHPPAVQVELRSRGGGSKHLG